MPLLLLTLALTHADHGTAHYLGNAGVLVADGDVAVVFDPLFRRDFGRYERVPADIEAALMRGAPPFEDLVAVFISHYHEDHFSPALMMKLLRARPTVHIYAPAQAMTQLRRAAGNVVSSLDPRLHAVRLDYGDPPYRDQRGAVLVEAVRIPHSGWPDRMRIVENIAFRVTLNQRVTVVHLGDATDQREPFVPHRDHWRARQTQLALPPYWFFDSESGRTVLTEELRARHSIGVHVPRNVPDERSARENPTPDLFTRPGETRRIEH